MRALDDVTQVIGRTPLVRLRHLSTELGVEVFAKLESMNPGGSVKDRIALSMVNEAEKSGVLKRGATLVEPTSGNTGIALAMISATRGYHLILTMPAAMSEERVQLLRAYGAEVVLTPGTLMASAVEQAESLGKTTPGAVMLRQFENPANPLAHEQTTGPEIFEALGGELDVFVAGVGTGGTITGVARALKPTIPGVKIVAVEPSGAAVLSGCSPTGHNIQGLGAGFIPKVLDRSVIDEIVTVDEPQALAAARRVARTDGILAGISSGAAVHGVVELSRRPGYAKKRFVVILCDTGERYVSTELFKALSS